MKFKLPPDIVAYAAASRNVVKAPPELIHYVSGMMGISLEKSEEACNAYFEQCIDFLLEERSLIFKFGRVFFNILQSSIKTRFIRYKISLRDRINVFRAIRINKINGHDDLNRKYSWLQKFGVKQAKSLRKYARAFTPKKRRRFSSRLRKCHRPRVFKNS